MQNIQAMFLILQEQLHFFNNILHSQQQQQQLYNNKSEHLFNVLSADNCSSWPLPS